MSIGTADWEEAAIGTLAELARDTELHLRGMMSREELAGKLGRVRSMLAEEEVWQREDNGYPDLEADGSWPYSGERYYVVAP